MYKFSLDYHKLEKLAICINKSVSKTKRINMHFDFENDLIITCRDGSRILLAKMEIQDKTNIDSFEFSLDKNKFVNMIDGLYEGMIDFKINKNYLKVNIDNISVKLRMAVYNPIKIKNYNLVTINGSRVKEFCNSVSKCINTIGDTHNLSGVLMDNDDSITRICKFSNTAIRIISHDKLLENGRSLIPTDVAKIIYDLRERITNVSFSKNKIILGVEDFISIYCSKLSDNYPVQYLSSLKLSERKNMVDFTIYNRYSFDKKAILDIAKIINKVFSTEESFSKWKLLGYDESTQFPVWSIGGSNYDEEQIEERIICNQSGVIDNTEFGVNLKTLIAVAKSIDSNNLITLHNDDLPLIICNEDGSDVSILLKVNR